MGWFSHTIDGVVSAVSPRAGLHRKAARLRLDYAEKVAERRNLSSGGFASAEKSRDAHNWMTSRLSVQSSIEADRPEMLARADAAYKNHELATNHVEGRTYRVVGCGTRLDPSILEGKGVTAAQAEDWNDRLRDGWYLQTDRIGRGNKPLWQVQQTMHRHYERHGEWFLLIGDRFDPFTPTSLKVEVIHPKRVETPPGKEGDPSVRMGVQLDSGGEVAGYYIRNTHPGDDKEADEGYTYKSATFPNGLPQVVHHYDEYEAGQRRGYPRMQVGQKRLKNADDYSEAEIERNYVSACHAAFVKTDLGPEEASEGEVVDGEGRRIKDYAPGTINYLGLADEIVLSNPGGAPSSYEGFIQSQARHFAAGAGTSYEVLANDFRGMTYATSRVIWNIEESTCAVLHKAHAIAIRAIYQNFVGRMVVSLDGLPGLTQSAFRSRPWLYWSARIVPPAKASIDPAKEDRNDLVKIEAGVMPASDMVERKNDGELAWSVYKRVAKDRTDRRRQGLEEHMPNMGRDPQPASDRAPTQPGDTNVESSEANSGVLA